jgi:hypothetical protein
MRTSLLGVSSKRPRTAAMQNNPSLVEFPPEMIAVVAADAARDADRVCLFLDFLGLPGNPEKPRPMPAAFLLHLGAALRLLIWESEGFCDRTAGLPEARQAILDAFQSLHDPKADPAELCVTVIRHSVERFAWNGRRDLNADVALDDLTGDDGALDALAEFLWASRHFTNTTDGLQP